MPPAWKASDCKLASQADMMAIAIPGCAEYRDPGLWG
jgi:hypothetical protein